MTEISYLRPLTGGLLIGLSAGLYLLLNGRIAGNFRLAAPAAGLTHDGDSKLGLGFLAGIIAGAWLAAALIRKPEIRRQHIHTCEIEVLGATCVCQIVAHRMSVSAVASISRLTSSSQQLLRPSALQAVDPQD